MVGSFALAVHGAPRASATSTWLWRHLQENLARSARAPERLETRLELGGKIARVSAADLGTRDELKLYTRFGILRLLGNVQGVPDFSILSQDAISVEVGGEPVMFCSRDDLVRMKQRRAA